jgi:predicted PhzF superfamily epimerase YddE/YHI9
VVGDDRAGQAVEAAGLPTPAATRTLALPKHYLLAEYGTHDEIQALDPDMDALRDHFGLFVFARTGDSVAARFFVPSAGVPEDPATGSAAVALAHEFKLRGEHEGSVTIAQGDVIRHPSTIHLAWGTFGARIGGSVVRDAVVQVS